MVIEWGYTGDPKPRDLAARRPPERYNRFNRSDSKQGNLHQWRLYHFSIALRTPQIRYT